MSETNSRTIQRWFRTYIHLHIHFTKKINIYLTPNPHLLKAPSLSDNVGNALQMRIFVIVAKNHQANSFGQWSWGAGPLPNKNSRPPQFNWFLKLWQVFHQLRITIANRWFAAPAGLIYTSHTNVNVADPCSNRKRDLPVWVNFYII